MPLLSRWRGAPVDQQAARQLFIGHFDCDEAHPVGQATRVSSALVNFIAAIYAIDSSSLAVCAELGMELEDRVWGQPCL